MASLRQHPRSRFWIACITKPNGKRTSRSTGILIAAPTSDERKEQKENAEAVARKWERLGSHARRGLMTPDRAREVVNDILRCAGADEIDVITTRSFLTTWLEGKTNPGTHERYKVVVDLFFTQLGDLADKSITRVGYKHILSFISMRREMGSASKTITVDTKCLGTVFNLARRLGHIPVNPVEQALAIQPIEVKSSTKGVFTPEQIAALVAAAEGDWRTATLLGYYTAARLRDCTNLRFSQIDWEQGIITVQQRKTKRPAWVPLHPCLRQYLEPLAKGRNPNDFVCPTLANRKTGGKTGLSKDFAAIMRKAGVDQGLIAGQGTRRFSTLSFHSLRHSFNSHLANLGVDQETRQVMTGHATKAANTDYTHLDLPKMRHAVELLPSVTPANATTTVPASPIAA
jgi:integrase